MKKGGLGGAILLAAVAVAFLVLDRSSRSLRAPVVPATPAPVAEAGRPVPPEPPPVAVADEPEPEARSCARIVGRVTDEDGHPIAGAEILLAGDVVTRTGEDGTYVIAAVAGKELLLGAIAKGYAPSNLHPVGPGDEIDIILRRGGGSLTLVIRAEDGVVPAAVVIIEPYFEGLVPEPAPGERRLQPGGKRVVRAAGDATVEGLVPEWSRVRVLARGYAPRFLPVRLHPGGPVEASVVLETGATLAGTVRTEDGASAAGALVRSVAWDAICCATADSAGAYRIEHLPAGRVQLEAVGAGGETWTFLSLENAKESRWDPILRPVAVISGRVVEEDGSPVARARVSCSWAGKDESQGNDVETDLDGAFRLEGCQAAEHVVSVWRPGPKGRVPAAEVSMCPTDFPVTITLRRGEGYVRGTVVDRTGAPAAGATIRIWPATRPDREARASVASDGSFRLGPFPPGPYLVEMHLDGEPTLHLRPAIEILTDGTSDLGVVRFPAGGRIRASVLEASGGVLPHEHVDVVSLDGSIRFAGEPDDGAFLSEELSPGSYLVRAPARCLLEEVAVVAGGLATVEMRLRPGGRLTAVTVLASGEPVDARFRIETLKGRILRDDIYDSSVFVAEGNHRIVATDGSGRRRGETVIRMGREDLEVVLVLE